MTKYKLVVAYDGTHYGGWQVQSNAVSIQALIEKALSTIVRSPTSIVGSGRTDAGVHARGQVAHFTAEPLDCFRLQRSLNGLLPPDIRILGVEEVLEDFHARYSALSKEYHYHLHLDHVIDPFKRLYACHIYASIDLPILEAAASCFVGTHDFTSFTNEAILRGSEILRFELRESSRGSSIANGASIINTDPFAIEEPRGFDALKTQNFTAPQYNFEKNCVRTISRLDVCQEPGGIRLEFEGDGFLYKMVRNITGTLLDVARGKLSIDDISRIFEAKDRSKAGAAAPPHGLFLIRVNYLESQKMESNELSLSIAGGQEDR